MEFHDYDYGVQTKARRYSGDEAPTRDEYNVLVGEYNGLVLLFNTLTRAVNSRS